jgi:hypothetical protein
MNFTQFLFYTLLYLFIVILLHHTYLYIQDKFTKPIVVRSVPEGSHHAMHMVHMVHTVHTDTTIPDSDFDNMNQDLVSMLEQEMQQ